LVSVSVSLWYIRRLRDKTNGCYGSPYSPGGPPTTADDAGAECLTTGGGGGAGRRTGNSATAPCRGSTSRRNYVKKPLNAFMLFMKEMRQRVIDECTLKESAAINQILGRKVRGVQVRCCTEPADRSWVVQCPPVGPVCDDLIFLLLKFVVTFRSPER